MPECIVCKGYYEPGQSCKRCGSDNTSWDNWRATRDEEKGGIEGLLAFSAPHLYLPFFMTVLAVAFGLMGIGGLWKGLTPAAQLLAVAVTVCGCLIATLAGHGARHEIREKELLKRVQQGFGASLGGTRLRAIVVPAFSLFLVLLIMYTMIISDFAWKLAEWFLLDPEYLAQVERQEATSDTTPEGEQPEETEGLRKRLRQVLPFTLMGMYVAFMISFAYSASLLLALVYAQEMNKTLPHPIFLQEDLLVKIVRREAERVVCRPITPRVIGGEEQRPRNWIWDEMERTADGGISLKAIVREGSKTEESLTGEQTESPVYVTYMVEADPWSRITKVVRVKEEK